jgi:hypothetical protein
MFKKSLLSLIILFGLSISIIAQQYPEVSIRDIQYQHPDSLLKLGDKPSPVNGDTVTITGIVMNPTYRNGTTTLISGAPAIHLQDTSITEYGGILVRFPSPSSAAFDALDSGTVAKFTGIVSEFNITTQFNLIQFDGSTIIDIRERPKPVLLTLDSLNLIGTKSGNILAEKWEGVYIEVRNVIVGSNSIGSGSFSIYDNNNTEVLVGNEGSYFRNRPAPLPGTVLEYVRGYIQNRNNVSGFPNAMIIMPCDPPDVKVSLFPPVISNVVRNPILVTPGQEVTVQAKIKDPDGTVGNAKLFWRRDSSINNELSMTSINDSTFQAIIPGQPDSCVIDFFLQATDNQSNVSITPADTSRNRYFYLVLNRDLTIQDVQYSPFGGNFSGYNGYTVTVSGVVTADTSDIPVGPQVMIQNGSGPWSGIRIFGTSALLLNKGDNVTVTGLVNENFSQTQIGNSTSSATVNVISTGNPLPEPQLISTSDISNKSSGTVSAEQWESVLIKYANVTVTDENADGGAGPNVTGNSNFGEILVADNSGINTRVELQDGNHSFHNFWDAGLENIPTRVLPGDKFDELIGILYFSFSNYKLIPRRDADFVGYTTSVTDESTSPIEYKLAQNYPNPFNPSTKINFSLREEGLVTLKVFNILGQEVATLVNDFKTAGNHSVNFDAGKLSSGIYLYKIDSNGFTQTRKMMLLK